MPGAPDGVSGGRYDVSADDDGMFGRRGAYGVSAEDNGVSGDCNAVSDANYSVSGLSNTVSLGPDGVSNASDTMPGRHANDVMPGRYANVVSGSGDAVSTNPDEVPADADGM